MAGEGTADEGIIGEEVSGIFDVVGTSRAFSRISGSFGLIGTNVFSWR